ncbi:MAG: M20 family metallopeptidase [Candidatus Bathyarchaeia archaeon]
MTQRILDSVDERGVVDFLRMLVRTPSLSGEEDEVAEVVAKEMEAVGLSVENIGGNVIGKTALGREARLVLNGHMDTVPVGDESRWSYDPFGADMEGGRVYGRGSCDMKGGVAAMVRAYDALRRAGVDVDGLLVTAVVQEESPKKLSERKGTIELIDRKVISGDAAVIGEPTGLGVGIGHRSRAEFDIEIRGRSAHASTPSLGVNAILKAARVVLALERVGLKEHPVLGKGTINVGLIEGGTKPNMVPDACRVVVDRRLTMGETPDTALADIERVIGELRDKDRDLVADVRCTYGWCPTLISEDEPIVKALCEAATIVFRREPRIYIPPYHTDGGFIHHMTEMPIAILGPGNEKDAHTADEYVEISQVIDATKIYALTIAKFFSRQFEH